MRAIDRWRVGKALAGDRDEAERIVRDHYPAVLRLLNHLTSRSDEAQDLAQRTFVRAHEALPRFRFDCPLRNWLLRIAVREYLHWRRDARPVAEIEEPWTLSGPSPERVVLRQALAALPVDLREPFLLRSVEGLSTRETAELLSIPEGTVKSRCHAARSRLRVALDPLADVGIGHESTTSKITHEKA